MRTKTGVVVSAGKMAKTIAVKVDSYSMHPIYGKRVKSTKKFYAHDEDNVAKMGQLVTIKESRPLSKLKRWALVS
nr:ribosomal protein S17 [uncultured bacterium]